MRDTIGNHHHQQHLVHPWPVRSQPTSHHHTIVFIKKTFGFRKEPFGQHLMFVSRFLLGRTIASFFNGIQRFISREYNLFHREKSTRSNFKPTALLEEHAYLKRLQVERTIFIKNWLRIQLRGRDRNVGVSPSCHVAPECHQGCPIAGFGRWLTKMSKKSEPAIKLSKPVKKSQPLLT